MRIYIGPFKPKRTINIETHEYDTFNLDETLAYIIVPLLRQFKDTTHSAPAVDRSDVPWQLRSNNEEFQRWDWVLDEMIWAFEQSLMDWEEPYYVMEEGDALPHIRSVDKEGLNAHLTRMQNGHRLFGKYFTQLWD